MVVELRSGCTDGRAGVICEEHHASGLGKTGREEVLQPKLTILRPGFSRVIRSTLEVETVDCHDTGEVGC